MKLTDNVYDDTHAIIENGKYETTKDWSPESTVYTNLYDRYFALSSQPRGFYTACTYDAAHALA